MLRRETALGIALLVGVGGLWAAEGPGTGERRTPPNAYSVLWPEANPLAKPRAKVPVPPIVWEKVAVRPDRPRLLFNKETKPKLQERLRGHPMEKFVRKAADQGDTLACAFLYQMTGREAYARKAIDELLAGRARDFPYLYDWTYDAMTEAERKECTERLWATVAIDRASGWPRCSPYTAYPADPRPSETPPDEWLPYYNWTFHDQDWARHYARTFFALAALAGRQERCEEGLRNFWEYSLKDPALFFDYLRDGSYWQGFYWSVTGRIEEIIRLYLTMQTACGIDALDPREHPYLGNVGRWLLYCSDPWRQRVIYNYGDGGMEPLYDRPRTVLIASNSLVRDPHVEWLIRTACPTPVHWLVELLYHDPTLVPRPPDDLPFARAFPGTGLVVMRSGWAAGDLWASFRWADFFDAHDHNDVGSFILYCRGPLVPDSGVNGEGVFHAQRYYARAVAHNTLVLRNPATKGPLALEGGQPPQPKRTWTFAIGRDAWIYNQDVFDRADLLAFESQRLYDYCAGDGTRAYRPEELKEFVRQAVFLRDRVVVIFDRVETTRPEIEKRWVMHAVGEPQMDGRVVRTEVPGHIEDYDSRLAITKGKDGATLRVQTLLPAETVVRRIGGALPKIPVSKLVRCPLTTHRMGTGSRWGWTDPLILKYQDDLTGKPLGFLCIERDSPTDATYEVTESELSLKLHAYERGRTDELRLKLADYPTLLDLAREVGKANLWHSCVHYLPGYEYYNEGINYAAVYGVDKWSRMETLAPELQGQPNDFGSWRIEVRPKRPAARDCFLHVLQVLREDKDPIATVSCQDAPERAQATVALPEFTYVISFAKTGEVGGHIRITDREGKVVADADFARKIVQEDWR